MKFNWKHFFEPATLIEAEEAYKNGHVYSFETRENEFRGKVYSVVGGSVKIKYNENGITNMTCDCLETRKGKKCKHKAAVLYSMEAAGIIEKTEPLEPIKLQYSSKSENQYYDLETITGVFDFFEDGIEAAKEMIRNGYIEIESVEEGISSVKPEVGKTCKMICKTKVPRKKRRKVELEFSKDELVFACCETPECFTLYSTLELFQGPNDRKACPHLVAAFMLADEYLSN